VKVAASTSKKKNQNNPGSDEQSRMEGGLWGEVKICDNDRVLPSARRGWGKEATPRVILASARGDTVTAKQTGLDGYKKAP